jgi:hypothetical protein
MRRIPTTHPIELKPHEVAIYDTKYLYQNESGPAWQVIWWQGDDTGDLYLIEYRNGGWDEWDVYKKVSTTWVVEPDDEGYDIAWAFIATWKMGQPNHNLITDWIARQ